MRDYYHWEELQQQNAAVMLAVRIAVDIRPANLFSESNHTVCSLCDITVLLQTLWS